MLLFFEKVKEYSSWMLDSIKNYGWKTFFIVVTVVILIGGTIFGVGLKLDNILQDRDLQQREQIKESFNISRYVYSDIKHIIRECKNTIDPNYILYIEYHNGVENVSTVHHFCRFDVTLELCSDTLPYIPALTDENLYKYDILSDLGFVNKKIICMTTEEVYCYDRLFYNNFLINSHSEYIVLVNVMYNGYIAGTIIFLTNRVDNHDLIAMFNCAENIETILNKYSSENVN